MSYQELLASDFETLKAKYVEIFGEEPVDLNKQQMASKLAKAYAEPPAGDSGTQTTPADGDTKKRGDYPGIEASKSNDKPPGAYTLADLNEIIERLTKENAELKNENAQLKVQIQSLHAKGTFSTPIMESSEGVHLVKKNASGEVIESQSLPKAAWAALPKGQKAEWEVATPSELQ